MGLERRKAILAAAKEHNVPVIEDSPYRYIHDPDAELPPSLFSLAPEQVISVVTLSKSVLPGPRVAWVAAADQQLIRYLIDRKADQKMISSPNSEVAMAHYLNHRLEQENMLVSKETLQEYAERRKLYLAGLEEAFRDLREKEEVSWISPKGGFVAAMYMKGVDTEILLEQYAKQKGVTFVPGWEFTPKPYRDTDGARSLLRLSFSTIDKDKIMHGLKKLREAYDEMKKAA